MKKVPLDKIFTAVLQAAAAAAIPFVIIANIFPTVDEAIVLEGIASESSAALGSVSESVDRFERTQSGMAGDAAVSDQESEPSGSMSADHTLEASSSPSSSAPDVSSTGTSASSAASAESSSVPALSSSVSASSSPLPAESSSVAKASSSSPSQSSSKSSQSASAQSASGKININTASFEQLKTLSGIGDVKAQAIIDYREQNGGFKSVDELINVKGIGTATLEKVREYITV